MAERYDNIVQVKTALIYHGWTWVSARLNASNSVRYKWKEQEVTTCGRGRWWCGVPGGRGNINLFSDAFVWEPVD
jgi:hypothetical protein